MRRFAPIALAAACVVLGAATAWAGRVPVRTGFYAGFGLGLGNASWDWTVSAPDSRNRGSGTGYLRFGTALREDFLVGFEALEWIKSYDLDADGAVIGDAEVSLTALTAAATWFPLNHGAYLRVGAGPAVVHGQVDLDGGGVHVDEHRWGGALLTAAGYEWRLSDRFAAAPQFEFVYFGVSGGALQNAILFDGSAQFTWYW